MLRQHMIAYKDSRVFCQVSVIYLCLKLCDYFQLFHYQIHSDTFKRCVIFLYKEISEAFPEGLFHYPTLLNSVTNTLEHWYWHVAGKGTWNTLKKLYIHSSHIKEPKYSFILHDDIFFGKTWNIVRMLF